VSRTESIVFSPGRIGTLEIKNRLIRSATFENAATSQGGVSDSLVDLYRSLAKGGVGLIITGVIGVYPKALAPHGLMRVDDDSCIASLARIPQVVHEVDPDCRVMLQLHHPGRQIVHQQDGPKLVSFAPRAWMAYFQKHPELLTPPREMPPVVEPTAPSSIYDATFGRTPRALTLDEIQEIIEAFADGTRRAEEAGFDGVQIHAAHGYLLSSFLSPRTNNREDRYGGSTENRTRMIKEIYQRVRSKVSSTFPILVKINITDFLPGGMDVNEAVRVGKELSDTGFGAIETSGGMWEAVTRSEEELGWVPVILPESRTGIRNKDQEAYFLPGAKALKEETNMTIILVGGLRSLERIEDILNSKIVDFVSMSRPFVRQPDLPNLWLSGKGPDKAECVSCNACLPVGNLPLSCRAKTQ
jgi:2,4-dienoyl-CoA reductase-like NADH-dependent reductase (Old Yellow Enzyme family)